MNSTQKLLSDFARHTVDLLTGRPAPPLGEGEPAPLVPGYLVRRLIGRGGFASAYLVRSIEGEDLVLKILPGGTADPARRSGDEAAAAGRHPNVVSVRGHGVSG